MPKIALPTPLRPYAGGRDAVDAGVARELTSWLLSEDRSIMREEPILPARRTA